MNKSPTSPSAEVAGASDIARRRREVVQQHGDWTAHNIHLGHGVYTIGEESQSRKLQRLVQSAADLVGRPLASLRVLDLACLEGGFAIEFARHGAEVVGIEGRAANLAKAQFAKDVIGLPNLTFHMDDVRNLSESRYGRFDLVICAGILYHLDAPDAFEFVANIAAVCDRAAIVDTSISLRQAHSYEFRGHTYFGNEFPEYDYAANEAAQQGNLWGSLGNMKSVWVTRPSLLNLLSHQGFTSVFEVDCPYFRQLKDRVFLAAIKGHRQNIYAMPALDQLAFEDWPEQPIEHFDPMQRRSYRLNKRVTAMVPKPVRRAAKSALRALGFRRYQDAPWNWKQPWRSR